MKHRPAGKVSADCHPSTTSALAPDSAGPACHNGGAAPARPAGPAARRARVAHLLLIDDDVDFAEALRDALAGEGHRARALDSAEDALRLLSAPEPFDLVLLDNRMPRMSGLEFLAAASEQGLRVPVVLMTSAHQASTAI